MKAVRKITSGIVAAMLVICVAAFIMPRIFGMKMFCVLSGSMEPELSAGDLVYVAPAEFENIKPGDVISFVASESGVVVTHRVTQVDAENRQFATKGDANNSEDARTADYRNVLGKVKLSVPHIGSGLQWASTSGGKIILISIVVAVSVISVLLGSTDKGERKKDKEEVAATDEE